MHQTLSPHTTITEEYARLVDALIKISEKHLYASRLSDAVHLLEHGDQIIIANEHVHQSDYVRFLIQYGKMLNWISLMGDNCFADAESIFNKAIRIAESINAKGLRAYALLHLGNNLDFQKTLLDKGDWLEALHLLQEARGIFLDIDDKVGQGTAEFFIGLVHQRLQQRAEAIEHFSVALDLARQNKDKFEEFEAIMHLGFFAFLDGDLDKAHEYALSSLRLREEVDCKIAFSSAHFAMGMSHESRNDLTDAIASYERSVELARELTLKIPLVQASLALSSAHEKVSQMQAAKTHALQASKIAQETGYPRFIEAAATRLKELA